MLKVEKTFEFQDKQYFIRKADSKTILESQRVYNKAFRDAIENGAILRKALEEHMRRQGLWDDEKQKEYETLVKKIADIEYKIKSGFYKKASELREKSIELKNLRDELVDLLSIRHEMDSVTADGIAENERFFYLVSACVYDYATQKPVFSSLEDYKERSDSELAVECTKQYAEYMYGLNKDFRKDLVENKVLKRLGLIDEEGNLIDRRTGRRVDEDGFFIDDEGYRVDANGNRIDINGNPILPDDAIDNLEIIDDLGDVEASDQSEQPSQPEQQVEQPEQPEQQSQQSEQQEDSQEQAVQENKAPEQQHVPSQQGS